jgi:hypothetical protein
MRLTEKKKLALIALALGLLVLVLPSGASGSHVRPKGATPVSDSLVIAQKPCTAPNRQHGAPIALPSCDPPLPQTNFLTVGTPDVNNNMANFIGRVLIQANPFSGNIQLTWRLSDVRCLVGNPSPACFTAGSGNLDASNNPTAPDYAGQLELVVGFQITDHFNDPGTGFTAAGTTDLIPASATVQCPPGNNNTAVGSTCSGTTTLNAIWGAGATVNSERMVFEIPQGVPGGGIRVFDGGSSSTAGAADKTLFAEPGLFLP